MKTLIKQLTLTNFKGIKSLKVTFTDNTQIMGANATGKSTVFDAFTWLLFGKDSHDRKDFEIKTLDTTGNPIHKIEHSVEGLIDIDGKEILLKRVYKEKWVKKQGTTEVNMTGHETLFYIDEVPVQAGQYQGYIDSLIKEDLFKLITNPMAFNSLPWQNRRSILMQIAGMPTDAEIAATRKEFQKFLNELSGKSVDDFKKMIREKKKRLQDDLNQIPVRIDETRKATPDKFDWNKLEINLNDLKVQKTAIEEQIRDISKANEAKSQLMIQWQERLYNAKIKLQEIENRLAQNTNAIKHKTELEVSELRNKQNLLTSEIRGLVNEMEMLSKEVEAMSEKAAKLRSEYKTIQETEFQFDPESQICPTCKRKLDDSDIHEHEAELRSNFNQDKNLKLTDIQVRGKQIVRDIQNKNERIGQLNKLIEEKTFFSNELQDKITEISNRKQETETDVPTELIEAKKALDHIRENAPENEKTDYTALDDKRNELEFQMTSIQRQLDTKVQIERGEKRISELEAESKQLAQSIADLEAKEYLAESFTNAKVNALEQRVNGMFPTVRFKLFNQQINGGMTETCETLIFGVPFSDANNAARINSGIEIINVLSKYYDVYAPIFADNAEAVNVLQPTESQLVKLIVTTDPELKIA